MTLPPVVLGSPEWLAGAAIIIGLAAAAIGWSYARAGVRRPVVVCCAILKGVAFAALAFCLLDPLLTGTKAVPGANMFLVVADDSQSMRVNDGDADETRADWAREVLREKSDWRTRIGQDFDVRHYTVDRQLRSVDGFDGMEFAGTHSSLTTALDGLGRRYRDMPVAGILLVTDGIATDVGDLDLSGLPPVYPVMPEGDSSAQDLGVNRVTLNQTNFEEAPVVVQAEVVANGFDGEEVVATVYNERGEPIESQRVEPEGDRETLNFRFQLKPEKPGVSFYRVGVAAVDEDEEEQTLANNSRLVVVERGGGPYRVLYVSGRPNWEFKYLNRSIEDDAEIDLVGLIRIAKRQPKFDFRDPRERRDSQLFKGFEDGDEETAEARDEAVLIRLNTRDQEELRTGFPQTAEELYGYHAIVLDDVEAAFFNQDQLALLRNFVSKRGGGFLMLGGPGSFADGKYARTPVGELLPVYFDRPDSTPLGRDYRLVLTREGWLQPWVRTRKTEADERRRLAGMASFHSIERVGKVKPGAAVLSEIRDADGETRPALVAQQYGKGRSAALLVGDLWRWSLKRDNPAEDDFDRSWRQTVRWLVADVPQRVELDAETDAGGSTVEFSTRAMDGEYLPLDNASVTVTVTRPDGEAITLTAQPDDREAGLYVAKFVPKQAGAYRALATVTDAEGETVGTREAGWVSQPEAEEFARMRPNRELMETIAAQTGGEVIDGDDLDSFAEGLTRRDAPVSESYVYPLWHSSVYCLITLLCLVAEWGLRRVNGLA